MDQSLFSKLFAKIGFAILALALADLLFLNWVVIKQEPVSRDPSTGLGVNQGPDREIVLPTDNDKTTIVSSPSPNSTVETKTAVEKETPLRSESSVGQAQTIVQTAQKEIFIPIGSGSTKSRSWVDLSGLEVAIDTSKYSAIDSVVFEGSVWVQDANGKAYAQLYNKTDGSTVWSSEITSLASTGTLKTSPKINLASGNKTYVVQAKTDLVEYAAHVDNARIKITLK